MRPPYSSCRDSCGDPCAFILYINSLIIGCTAQRCGSLHVVQGEAGEEGGGGDADNISAPQFGPFGSDAPRQKDFDLNINKARLDINLHPKFIAIMARSLKAKKGLNGAVVDGNVAGKFRKRRGFGSMALTIVTILPLLCYG